MYGITCPGVYIVLALSASLLYGFKLQGKLEVLLHHWHMLGYIHSRACANGQMPIYAIKTQFSLRNSVPLKSSHALDLWRPNRGGFEIFTKVKYMSVS